MGVDPASPYYRVVGGGNLFSIPPVLVGEEGVDPAVQGDLRGERRGGSNREVSHTIQ